MPSTANSRKIAWLGPIVSLILTLGPSRPLQAQVAPAGFFTDPILVLRVGGHQAPVRSMVFEPRGNQLITAGMDKVIHVWNLDVDRSGPIKTFLPPQWRGSRGQINAMAFSPRDDGGNQRFLAVAGSGVLGDQGEILLFRYPGVAGPGSGEVVGQLPASTADGVIGPGHKGVVNALGFTPDGRFLASASNDKTVQIWDVDARKQVAVLREALAEVNALSLFAGGTRLVTGGSDGIIRLYDLTVKENPKFLAQHPQSGRKPPFEVGARINAIAASPDGRLIVAGTEQGSVGRFDPDLGSAIILQSQANDARIYHPIQALTFSPDSSKLAISSTASNLGVRKADIPTIACSVEIRSVPEGQLLESLPIQSNLIQALAFSPDGKRLAYSGGNAQSIFFKDFDAGAPAFPEEIRGYGSSVWDVGFRIDGQAIRFARTRPQAAGQGADYEYFNIKSRAFFNPEANDPAYRHARTSESGWTITPVDQFKFNFVNAQGQGWQRELNPINERRWWAYTVIPPGPGHPQPVAAVAADAGIVLWNLETGVKTRFFNGHSGPVYAIASSIDGKWLLTGSADQTVRLWPLEGCDSPPKFGAKFERQVNGDWIVAEVTPGGFADGIALKKGHRVEKFFIGKDAPAQAEDPSTYLLRLDQESPTWMYSFHARMNGDPAQPLLQAGTTKRDSPALSLFPGVDRRWVLWTPRGFYDSSADGDRKFLGWLTNRGAVTQLLTSTFDSIDKFEARFRQPRAPQPNVIDRLLETANPLQAEAIALQPPAQPAQPQPPDPVTSRLAALDLAPAAPKPAGGPLVVAEPTVAINYRALAQTGAAGIRRLWIEVNGRMVSNLIAENAQDVRTAQGRSEIPIGTDRYVRVSLVAIDERGVRRDQTLDLRNQSPPPQNSRKSKLEIIALGAEEFADKRFPRIAYAEEDARDLTRFLAEKLIDPATGTKFAPNQVVKRTFLGDKLSRTNLVEAFDSLTIPARSDQLVAGDMVVVVVESHYLESHSKRMLATTDVDPGHSEPPSISATEMAARLGELSRAGCRVIVLIDAVHEIKSPAWDLEIQDWVRQLQGQAQVLTFIAADHGPSSPNGDGHRVFAQGILDALKAKSAGRIRKPGPTMSLFDFQRTVTDSVLQQTGRKQHAQFYLPDTISFSVPFLDSSPR